MRAVVTDSVSHQLSAMQPSKPLGNLLTFSESCCCCLVLTPWTAAHQASPSFTISRNVLKFMFTELVMPSTRLLFCFPLLPLPSVFPSIKVFSSELALHIRWPKYWNFSFSISLSNEYSELISFGWTGLICLQSKGLSRVFSNTTIRRHQFFGAQSSLWFNSHIRDF